MISTTEQFPFGSVAPRAKIRAVDWNYAVERMERICAPIPTEEPFDWAARNLTLDDPEVKGPFQPDGREYLRDIINDNNDPECREQTLITGTGVGKTLTNIAGIAWKIVHHPARGLMVMPATKGEGGAETFVNSRLIPALEATAATRDLMPDGQRRLFMNSKKVRINGSHFGFVGANSSSQIASNRCGDIRMDEADKFKGRLGNEAGTASLVKERIEGVADYQIFLNTTPTIETGLGWKNLMRSDFRRRFLPCPHCNSSAEFGMRNAESKTETPHSALRTPHLKGWFTLAWSEQYCVLPTKFSDGTPIPTAYIAWDTEAKRKDGSYDLDRVFRSTRLVCPHCQGHVLDTHKNWMDARGIWLPTQAGTPHHKGYHLSSLYAPPIFGNENSLLGGRALKFLNAMEDGEGMKGFINSTLAEVDVSQEHGGGAIQINSAPVSQPDWVAVMTADFHKNAPYIWFVIRRWCAFKLLPPVTISNGLPDFVQYLELPGNEGPRAKCLQLIGHDTRYTIHDTRFTAAWHVLAELFRFKSGDYGESPMIEFLLAQKITGEKLVKLFRETAESNTMEFRRLILLAMFEHEHGQLTPEIRAKFRPPRGGDSELIAAGNLDTSGPRLWEDLRDLETEFKVGHGLDFTRRCTLIDCGFQDKFDAEVLQQSYERAEHFKWWNIESPKHAPLFNGLWKKGETPSPARGLCQPCAADGWLPLRGIPTNRPQGDGKISRDLSLRVSDPFYGTPEAGQRVIEVLNVPSGLFWHRRQDLRQGRTKNLWTISPHVSWFPKHYTPDGTRTEASSYRLEDYQKQSDGQYWNEQTKKVEPKGGRGGSQSKRNPYHVDDCEVYQVAAATHLEFFETKTETKT